MARRRAALLAMAPIGVSVGAALLVVAHAFCAGRWEGRAAGLIGSAALIAALQLTVLAANDSGEVPAVLLPAAGWGAGRALRERELVAARLAEQARALHGEREAHAALSARYERARIASELHDIVAHAISVMVIQASAGQRLATHGPVATAETFEAIAGAARQAEQTGSARWHYSPTKRRSARRRTWPSWRNSSRAPPTVASRSRCTSTVTVRACRRASPRPPITSSRRR